MDALAELLETVHLRGNLYCRSDLRAPWGMALPASDRAGFHVLRRGRCWLLPPEAADWEPLLLEAGDLVVLPRGDAHVLADQPDTPALPLVELIERQAAAGEACGVGCPLRLGGDGDRVDLICGYFGFDRGTAHPMLAVLPPLIVLRGEGGRPLPWLETTLELIAGEMKSGRVGAEALINRFTEALFIQVLRAHLEQGREPEPSWLAGLRDERIASALGAMHGRPGETWSVPALASESGMSRSAFSARFQELVGESPLQYLTRWRMQVAAGHLREGRMSIAEIAAAVGYQAEASFSKAFKKLLDVAPGAYRRARGMAGAGPARGGSDDWADATP